MGKLFTFKLVKTSELSYSRKNLISLLAWSRYGWESEVEKRHAAELSELSDEQLLNEFQKELDNPDGILRRYMIKRADKWGELQTNELTLSLTD